jgi:pyruvate dehydrogenase E2 component (dihydrolipoamide acetyltransferase)
VESFTPVINPPQTAILGVCALTTKLKADGTPYQAMGLSLTFDHRAVDGAPAARFLKDLCEYLESFTENLSLENALGGAL